MDGLQDHLLQNQQSRQKQEVEFSLPPPCFLLPNWLIQTV